MRKFLTVPILAVLVFSLFPFDAEANKRRKPRKKKAPVINEKKLFERIGGEKRMSEIVQEWVRISLEDPRVSAALAGVAAKPEILSGLRKSLNEQLCEIADGPCRYKGPEFKKGHGGIRIDETQFLVLGENLFLSMERFRTPEREKNEMMGRLGEIRSEFIHDAPAEG
jgi:hemoglobin